VAEFLLYGRTDYEEVLEFAASLRETGERTGSERAVAFAATVAGEVHLLSGDLDRALEELQDGGDLHHQMGANAGEALSLQRLAETHVELGNHEEALRLLESAVPLARWSPIAQHLIQRIFGSMIRATVDPVEARTVVGRADKAIGPSDMCRFCTVMIAAPSSIACSRVGDLDEARRRLAMAENSAMAWQGTAWQGAVAEAKAHLALAENRHGDARERFEEAADLFARAGQPLDADRCRAGITERKLSSVLFTDLVDSTGRAAAGGDKAWREQLDRHDQRSRQEFDKYGGQEVKQTGDGFVVTFDSPAQAIGCARALCDALGALDLEIRAGVHTGEIEVRGDDIGGLAVHIGARVMAEASAGEVVVSQSVPPLVAGSGLEFESRGHHVLKGVPGEWELLEVTGP
jgi:class 3 adenylate cyclase